MKLQLLQGNDQGAIRSYLTEKFKQWESGWYPKFYRNSKVIRYYAAAAESNRSIITSLYSSIFRQPWPKAEADAAVSKKMDKYKGGMSREDKLAEMQELRAQYVHALNQLEIWEKEGATQEGEMFFTELKGLMEPILPGTFDPARFHTEAEMMRVKELTGTGSAAKTALEANFDAMVGMRGQAKVVFDFNYGDMKGATELFVAAKGGAWASGSFATSIAKTGLDAKLAVAIGVGAKLEAGVESTWTKDGAGMKLEGGGKVFVGAEAAAKAVVAATATEVNLAFKAKAFAGVKASVSGTASLLYDNAVLASATGTANVSWGVGAEFHASITSSLFDGTKIEVGSSVALGVGTGAEGSTTINFLLLGIGARAQFMKAVYLPTLAKGYKMDMQNMDRKNMIYFTKAVITADHALQELDEDIDSMENATGEQAKLIYK